MVRRQFAIYSKLEQRIIRAARADWPAGRASERASARARACVCVSAACCHSKTAAIRLMPAVILFRTNSNLSQFQERPKRHRARTGAGSAAGGEKETRMVQLVKFSIT